MPRSPSPTSVVIAHGAFHKASAYDELSRELGDLGIKAVVPQLPSSSTTPPDDAFAADVEVLHHALRTELSAGHNVILLTHSYGGIPGCEALKDMPEPSEHYIGRVLGIVFVSAFVAEEGQSLLTSKMGGPASWVRLEPPLAYVNDAETSLFTGISDSSKRASCAANLTAQALSSFVATVSYAGWKHYPAVYLRCGKDQAQRVGEQEHYIERLQQSKTYVGQVMLEEADHCPHASMPKELALKVSATRELFERVAK